MLSNEELREIINREENHIDDYLSIIERYIYDRKGVDLKLQYNKDSFLSLHNDFNLIMYYYEIASKWYKTNEKSDDTNVHRGTTGNVSRGD